MTNNVMLEQAAMLDLIDQLRIAIPEEVKQARRINQESDRVIAKAREEAEQIIGAAQEQAALLLQDQSILREAESRAQELLDRMQSSPTRRCAAPISTRPTSSYGWRATS